MPCILEQLCPTCQKNGKIFKLEMTQVNLSQALYTCLQAECKYLEENPWTFVSRNICDSLEDYDSSEEFEEDCKKALAGGFSIIDTNDTDTDISAEQNLSHLKSDSFSKSNNLKTLPHVEDRNVTNEVVKNKTNVNDASISVDKSFSNELCNISNIESNKSMLEGLEKKMKEQLGFQISFSMPNIDEVCDIDINNTPIVFDDTELTTLLPTENNVFTETETVLTSVKPLLFDSKSPLVKPTLSTGKISNLVIGKPNLPAEKKSAFTEIDSVSTSTKPLLVDTDSNLKSPLVKPTISADKASNLVIGKSNSPNILMDATTSKQKNKKINVIKIETISKKKPITNTSKPFRFEEPLPEITSNTILTNQNIQNTPVLIATSVKPFTVSTESLIQNEINDELIVINDKPVSNTNNLATKYPGYISPTKPRNKSASISLETESNIQSSLTNAAENAIKLINGNVSSSDQSNSKKKYKIIQINKLPNGKLTQVKPPPEVIKHIMKLRNQSNENQSLVNIRKKEKEIEKRAIEKKSEMHYINLKPSLKPNLKLKTKPRIEKPALPLHIIEDAEKKIKKKENKKIKPNLQQIFEIMSKQPSDYQSFQFASPTRNKSFELIDDDNTENIVDQDVKEDYPDCKDGLDELLSNINDVIPMEFDENLNTGYSAEVDDWLKSLL